MLLFLRPMLSILGAKDSMMPYAKEYAIPFIIGLAFNVFNIIVNNMIAAEGATNFSMIDMLAGGVTNIILDPVMILGLNMGVRGAMIATFNFWLEWYHICTARCGCADYGNGGCYDFSQRIYT